MFSKKTIILLLITIHCLIDIVSMGKILDKVKAKADKKTKDKNAKPADQKVSKAPKLTAQQIEFSKKFFKNMMEDQEKGEKGIPLNYSKSLKVEKGTKLTENNDIEVPEDGIDKPEEPGNNGEVQHAPQSQPSPGGIGTYRSVPSGGTIFLDGLVSNFVPVGDPYSGMPDREIFIKGALVIIYTTIRWPHKILLKMILFTGAIAWVPATLIYCLSPVSMSRFVGKSKIISNKFDELADLQYKLKVRQSNMIDKVYSLKEVQKISCCMFNDWRDSSVRTVDDDAKEWLMHWYHSFTKLMLLLYCGDYNDGTEMCENVEFDGIFWYFIFCFNLDFNFSEAEPLRVIPRSHITLWVEMFVKFF